MRVIKLLNLKPKMHKSKFLQELMLEHHYTMRASNGGIICYWMIATNKVPEFDMVQDEEKSYVPIHPIGLW